MNKGKSTPDARKENPRTRTLVKKNQKSLKEASKKIAQAQILLTEDSGFIEPESPLEKTHQVTQTKLKQEVDVQTAEKIFNLELKTYGPYKFDFSMNGRNLLLGGAKGHLALMNWQNKTLRTEVQVKEVTKDIKFLQNESMFAAAQKKYVFIYDKHGVELHCLKNHIAVNRLEFLPYHFLLASVGEAGWLKYQDVSTGQLIVEHRTKLGSCDCMRQNPKNAVINLGHYNGTVTMWTPNMTTPVVTIKAHSGPVKAVAFDRTGNYMVSAGLDTKMKIWDLRTYQCLNTYYCVPSVNCLDVSQRGLVAASANSEVKIWKDVFQENKGSFYMKHRTSGKVEDIHFCPYEDVLGISHENGYDSIVVPGAGEPNFDTFEANPFETKKQRREAEVHRLLNKLQPDMIALDPDFIGTMEKDGVEIKQDAHRLEYQANNDGEELVVDPKKKKKRRSYRSRQNNIWDEKKAAIAAEAEKKRKQQEEIEDSDQPKSALDRFKRKKDS